MLPRYYKLAIALVTGTLVGVGAAAFVSSKLEAARPPTIAGFLWPDPPDLPEFTLIDQRGEPFGRAQLKDRWSFLFFGYTHCPDVCPTTLATLVKVFREVESDDAGRHRAQVVFISVDPVRDTPGRLGEYVAYFDPAFFGVSGPNSALEPLARQLGILVRRDVPDDDGNYLVAHGSAVLLVDPKGRFVGVFQAPHDPAAIATSYRPIRDFLEI